MRVRSSKVARIFSFPMTVMGVCFGLAAGRMAVDGPVMDRGDISILVGLSLQPLRLRRGGLGGGAEVFKD